MENTNFPDLAKTNKAKESVISPLNAYNDSIYSKQKSNYAEHKEQQKKLRKAEKTVSESEARIERMEKRLKELDDILCIPENASNMDYISEYTVTKKNH